VVDGLVGSTPIGSPVIGALSDTAGPRYALGLGAAACLAAAILGGWPGGGLRQNSRCRPPLAQI
jgi:MFS family permease